MFWYIAPIFFVVGTVVSNWTFSFLQISVEDHFLVYANAVAESDLLP